MMNLESLSERYPKNGNDCCSHTEWNWTAAVILDRYIMYSTILDRYIMYSTILDHYKSMFGNGIVLTNYVSHLLLMHCHSFFINWIKLTNDYVHIALYINSGVWQLMNAVVAAAPIALWSISQSHPRAYSWALPSRRHSLSDDQSWTWSGTLSGHAVRLEWCWVWSW